MEPWQFNLRHLEAFVAICARGSVNKAAQKVNLSQPAVTQGIALLERLLHVSFFTRTARGMERQRAADIFLPRAISALQHISSKRVTSKQTRAFRALAKGGSYSSAAELAGLSEASIHRAVTDLSLALGSKLVERQGRQIIITRKGRDFSRHIGLANAELRAGIEELAELSGQEVGRISIGAMPLVRARVLPAALAEFRQLHPTVNLRILEGSYNELVGPLRDGELDMIIGALRGPSSSSDLEEHHLFNDKPTIIGRSDHPLTKKRGNPKPSELRQFEWIISAPSSPLHKLWKMIFEDDNAELPPVPIECGSVITIRQLLLAGDYLTLLSPDQLAVELDAGLLTQICPAPDNIARSIGMIIRSQWRPTPIQKSVMQQLQKHSITS